MSPTGPAPEFDVTATDDAGRAFRWKETAPSVDDLVRRYRGRGLQVSTVRGPRALRLFEPGHVDPEAFAAFHDELAAACRASIPLPGTLRILARDLAGRRFREAVDAVARDVEEGRSLADALAASPAVFPPAYVALVRAGLESGDLAGTFQDVAHESRLLGRAARLSRAALVYPLLLVLVGSAVLGLVASSSMPAMRGVFEDLGAELPVATTILFSLQGALELAPVLAIGLAASGIAGWYVLARASLVAPAAARAMLRMPFVGPFLKSAAFARFSRVLSSALSRGVPVPDAVSLAGLASGNAAVQAGADRTRRSIEEGERLSIALERDPVFPRTLTWLVSLAEARGDVQGVLAEFAAVQERTMERTGRALPVALSLLGTAVGALLVLFTAWALLMPLISLVDKLG